MKTPIIAIIGLGYVGYPLALAFGQHFETIGFDIDSERISQLSECVDSTNETDINLVQKATSLTLTDKLCELNRANIYIVTTATPVDNALQPELRGVIKAAKMVGEVISSGDTVVLESTVYPGMTQGLFSEAIEEVSSLTANIDFQVGYSPERINPGDEFHRLQHIVKVVSASSSSTLETLYQLYERIIPAGVIRADSIKTAELSKLIENTQRDVNIAFINEMYQLSDKLGLDFDRVIECANSKWNFLNFQPGLVGGHCVAVDPYYLIHSQASNGLSPRITASARQINEDMTSYVVNKFIKELTKKGLCLPLAKILILGVSFKPNCPDVRNSKHVEVIECLLTFGIQPVVYDPVVKVNSSDNFSIEAEFPADQFDGVLLLVPHDEVIKKLQENSSSLVHKDSVVYSLDSKYSDLLQ